MGITIGTITSSLSIYENPNLKRLERKDDNKKKFYILKSKHYQVKKCPRSFT